MRHILALSGGKDSTALAIYLKKVKPELPMEYVFSDTGRELPEVYEFIDALREILGEIVTITDNGRTFDYYLERWGYFLPGNASRWCTKHLKIRPFERYVGERQANGRYKRDAVIYIGIRADEDERVGNYGIDGVTYAYPFKDAGIGINGVLDILNESGVTMPTYYQWRSTGGCYMCPWQRKRDWLGLKRHHPDLFQRAVDDERKAQETSPFNNTTWSVGRVPLVQIEAQTVMDLGELEERNVDSMPCLICAK